MSLSRDTREEKKAKAALRAQFTLKQRFERIDWEEDVLYPLVAEIKAGRTHIELTAGEVVFTDEESGAHGNDS